MAGNKGRGWFGDSEGHSKAGRKGGKASGNQRSGNQKSGNNQNSRGGSDSQREETDGGNMDM